MITKILATAILVAAVTLPAIAQRRTGTRSAPRKSATLAKPPAVVPIKDVPGVLSAAARTYRNAALRFEITFPEPWRLADENFAAELRTRNIDLELRAPDELPSVSKVRLNRALKNVEILATAFRLPAQGATETAILRISSEDLTTIPEVKDAVDYFDMMRSQYKHLAMLPRDFKYSETQAELLGRRQFAFMDIATDAGKKRMYATVRDRRAILFVLSYRADADLQTLRQALASGNFSLK